jgi:hypothetical protein
MIYPYKFKGRSLFFLSNCTTIYFEILVVGNKIDKLKST